MTTQTATPDTRQCLHCDADFTPSRNLTHDDAQFGAPNDVLLCHSCCKAKSEWWTANR